MDDTGPDGAVEVRDGVVHTFEGEVVHVHGGAYLPPQAWLIADGHRRQLEATVRELHQRQAIATTIISAGALLAGAAVGYWLGRRNR